MRTTLTGVLVLLFFTGCQIESTKNDGLNEDLRQEMLEFRRKDQGARNSFMEAGMPDSLCVPIRELDSLSTVRLKEIVDSYGWPDSRLAGENGANAAFLIVQHSSDYSFQESVLPLTEESFNEGFVKGENLALLTDRVLVHHGRPQLYGSQAYEEGRVYRFRPIADSANLEQRRAAMGMMPFAQYVERMSTHYNFGNK